MTHFKIKTYALSVEFRILTEICFHTEKQDCEVEMQVSNAGAVSSRYFHFTFLHYTNTPMLMEVLFITMKITFNYSLLSLWFQRHKHWAASWGRKHKNSRLRSSNNRRQSTNSRKIWRLYTLQNCKKGFIVNSRIFFQGKRNCIHLNNDGSRYAVLSFPLS